MERLDGGFESDAHETNGLRREFVAVQIIPDRHCAENLTEILQCKAVLSCPYQRVRCTEGCPVILASVKSRRAPVPVSVKEETLGT